MIRALRGAGAEVVVVEPSLGSESEFGTESRLVGRLRRALPRFVFELLELAYNFVAWRKLRAACAEHRPDVVYERYNLFLHAGGWASRRFSIPLLLEVNSPLAAERAEHSGLALSGVARWSERTVWRSADLVLPVTGVLGEMISAAGVPPERIEVIPNGINREEFERAPSREEAKERLGLSGRLVLGFTGFVRPWHGLDRVIDLMASNARDDWCLLIVGDGPIRADLERQASSLGLANRVRFTGLVPRHAIPETIAAFDIALQPAATGYASPLKLFEYMAVGSAIVAPAQANIEEVLVSGENALLFRPGDLDDMTAQIARLGSDADLRRRLGNAARETVERRRLYWHENARRVIDLANKASAARTVSPRASAAG